MCDNYSIFSAFDDGSQSAPSMDEIMACFLAEVDDEMNLTVQDHTVVRDPLTTGTTKSLFLVDEYPPMEIVVRRDGYDCRPVSPMSEPDFDDGIAGMDLEPLDVNADSDFEYIPNQQPRAVSLTPNQLATPSFEQTIKVSFKNLAKRMRDSEVTMRRCHETLAASTYLMPDDTNAFFTNKRTSITTGLEVSRQAMWSLIHTMGTTQPSYSTMYQSSSAAA